MEEADMLARDSAIEMAKEIRLDLAHMFELSLSDDEVDAGNLTMMLDYAMEDVEDLIATLREMG